MVMGCVLWKKPLTRVALLSTLAALNMNATVLLLGSTEAQGGGFGSATNVLTVQQTGQDDGIQAGCIAGAAGGTAVGGNCLTTTGTFIGGDEKNLNNSNFNQLVTFGGSGAGGLRIGLNAAESGSDPSITITDLVLTLYDSTGGALYSTSGVSCNGQANCAAAANGITLTTQSGIGNFGFVFGLDSAQAAALNTAGPGRLGLAASFTGYSGGQETFVLVAGPGNVGDVPEPGTWVMIAGGVALIGITRLHRRTQEANGGRR